MNRKSELLARDGQNSEKAIHDKAQPAVVDCGASHGVYFYDHKNTPHELPILSPVWSEWWDFFGSGPIRMRDLWRLRGFERYRRDELSPEDQNKYLRRCIQITVALGEPVRLHDGTAAVIVDMGGGVFKLRRVYSGFCYSFQPNGPVSFSPGKYVFRSEVAL